VAAPYDRMPVYVAAGSILPIGELIQNTTEAQNDLTIYVYAGKDGAFTLYEDENVNYNYEKGAFSTIEFKYNDKTKTLDIAKRKGEFNGMIKDRNFQIVLIQPDNSTGIDGNHSGAKTVHYAGEKMSVQFK
jgi:alpha-D-xyloside xylohydrolase